MQDVVQCSRNVNICGHVMMVKFEIRMWKKMGYIFHSAGKQIVHRNDMKPFFDKPVAKMRSDKSRSPCDQHFLHIVKDTSRDQKVSHRRVALAQAREGANEQKCSLSYAGHSYMIRTITFGIMKFLVTLGLIATLACYAYAQEKGPALRSHLSFEYGGQIPMADMADRFGANFNLGSQFEILHTRSHWLAGFKGYYFFGNTVKEDVISSLRSPDGQIVGNDGGPATIGLRERGFFLGPYLGKLFPLSEDKPHSGIKLQVGVGLLQHHVRIQDDTRTVDQLTGDYRKGYDRLSNGMAGYAFLGYQHLDPARRINFLAGFDVTFAATESRRDFDFNLMRKDDTKRTDVLVGLRLGWILPVTSGIAPETIYY